MVNESIKYGTFNQSLKHGRIQVRLIYTTACFFLFSSFSFASQPVINGDFKVTSTQCEAYISKNKKTNPDSLNVYLNQHFNIVEVNRAEQPDWFRIVVDGNANPLRWVSEGCGKAVYELEKKDDQSQGGSCQNTPNQADSYVLALSWQAAFCSTYGYEAGKPECTSFSTNSFKANNLVLHGLWPNQKACGTSYGFCASEKKSNHCSYQPIEFNQEVANALKTYLPSFASGSCLERHEWNKHGTCQSLNPDQYFSQAVNLVKQVDESPFGQFISSHKGMNVSKEEVMEQFSKSFGSINANKVYLGCKNGMLVDVYLYIDIPDGSNNSIINLLNSSQSKASYSGCGNYFEIAKFEA